LLHRTGGRNFARTSRLCVMERRYLLVSRPRYLGGWSRRIRTRTSPRRCMLLTHSPSTKKKRRAITLPPSMTCLARSRGRTRFRRPNSPPAYSTAMS
jgi:hypothetical protein